MCFAPSTYRCWGSQPKHDSNPEQRSLDPIVFVGLGIMGIKLAKALGCTVTAISRCRVSGALLLLSGALLALLLLSGALLALLLLSGALLLRSQSAGAARSVCCNQPRSVPALLSRCGCIPVTEK